MNDPYGFTWGPMKVTRISEIARRAGQGFHRVLQVKAGKNDLNIYVSPTGRSVRVYRNGKELK